MEPMYTHWVAEEGLAEALPEAPEENKTWKTQFCEREWVWAEVSLSMMSSSCQKKKKNLYRFELL